MLPALFRKSGAADKSAFTRALERFRKNRALAQEQRAREEARKWEEILAGTAQPDEITVRCRCAVTGRYYRTLFRRRAADGKFSPVAQLKEEHIRSHGHAHHDAAAQGSTIDMGEFTDWNRLSCPWCGKKTVHATIRCGRCKQWVCSGRAYVDERGTLMHVCHEDCGKRGPVHQFEGGIDAERPAPQSRTSKALAHRAGRSPAAMLEHSGRRRR